MVLLLAGGCAPALWPPSWWKPAQYSGWVQPSHVLQMAMERNSTEVGKSMG